ncbi:8-oxo-dGTP diphosphatase MutT [Hahella sp. CR1]|uniref:8-oxo-dGTP diphosphatase MutT n=1 Tax=Hahella sp. CR1 TaxID=2992807 RepID=UPI002441FA22|nr:8-oxo-dGTP diphosphatase MutT [Hahella sp. CR1]MDG9670707.1 8-oxo-dGTP diphosphatase MutT [Hahella sp. CR1]
MKAVHVAVAVVLDQHNRVLVARRPDHLHQGGLLEFPGGKVEPGETVLAALQRELFEEVGVQVDVSEDAANPLIQIEHHYPDKHVLLDVWRVSRFSGEAQGREGQYVAWLDLNELDPEAFPAANREIIAALQQAS